MMRYFTSCFRCKHKSRCAVFSDMTTDANRCQCCHQIGHEFRQCKIALEYFGKMKMEVFDSLDQIPDIDTIKHSNRHSTKYYDTNDDVATHDYGSALPPQTSGLVWSHTVCDYNQFLNTPDLKTIKPYIPQIHSGVVIKVYDGDTVTIVASLQNDSTHTLYKFSVRLNGLDCAEMRTQNPTEQSVALLAQKYVSNLILNKTIYLKNVKTEKYGRILADIYLDPEENTTSINQMLIQERLAVPYNGKTKRSPKCWMKYHTTGCTN